MVKYQIQINEPCSEDWHKMTNLEKGKFCNSCKKQVFDFTQFSNTELARKIKKGDKICGRFKPEQLNTDLILPESSRLNRLRYLFSFTSLMTSSILLSQNLVNKDKIIQTSVFKDFKKIQEVDSVTVKGKVFDIQGDLPGASIQINNSKKFIETNYKGEFIFKTKKGNLNKSFKISIRYLGYKEKKIVVNKLNYNSLSINLIEDQNVLGGLVIIETKKPTLFSWIGSLFKKNKKIKKQECTNSSHNHKL